MVAPGCHREILRLAALAGLVITMASCAKRPVAASAPQPSPCADSTYQRMKRIPVDSLSAREFEIFRQRDAACMAAVTPGDRGDAGADGTLRALFVVGVVIVAVGFATGAFR